MRSDLTSPLLPLLDTSAPHDAGWLDAFGRACQDCIVRIDSLRASIDQSDRDLAISLDAVRNCLDWAIHEHCTVDEAHALVQRVVDILKSVSALV